MNPSDLLSVVLVRSIYSSNIGATSRAMVNMGFSRLILIDPQCEVNSKAQQAAAAAQEPLQNRTEYRSWKDFFAAEGDGLRIAMTRRGGKQRTVHLLDHAIQPYLREWTDGLTFDRPIYLVFGPENDGLNSDDLLMMNLFCSIPTYGDMGSLNLAQAVLIALFMLRQKLGTSPELQKPESFIALPKHKEERPKPLPYPEETIREWLEALGFDISSQRVNAYSTLTRILMGNMPGEADLRVLEAILQQNIRKLKG